MRGRSSRWTRWICAFFLITAALMGTGAGAYARSGPAAPPAPSPSTSPEQGSPTGSGSPRPCPSVRPGEPVPRCAGPSSTLTPAAPARQSRGGCWPWELRCQVSEAIDTWFTGLAMMAIPPVMDLFGKTLLATPRLDDPAMARVRTLWSTSETIANTCFVILVVIGGMLLMAGNTVAPGAAAKDIVARLLLAFIAANCSMLVLEQAIELANGLARAFVAYGAADADPHGAGELMKAWLVDNVATVGLLSGLVTLVAVVLALIVAGGYVMRIAVTMLLVAAAPLALSCHALPQTDGLARLWWRAVCGMLTIQVAQSLLFATAVIVLSAGDGGSVPLIGFPGRKGLADLLLVVCLLYILARIPSWVSRAVWRGALGGNPVSGAARFLFSALVLRRITRGLGGQGGTRSFPLPRVPRPPVPARPPVAKPTPTRWVQPELPLPWPAPRGEQLEIPGMPPLRPVPERGIQLQLPLRPPAKQTGWWQEALPINVRAEQLRLPFRLPRQHTQAPLFTEFDRGRRPRPRPQDFPPRGPDPRDRRSQERRGEHR